MKKYYTYRITNKITSCHYYGSRGTYLDPSSDLGIHYLSPSSDKSFIEEQVMFPYNFKYKVIQTYTTMKEASIKTGISMYKLRRYYINEAHLLVVHGR